MDTPILKIAGLHKSYGDNAVLKGIDLEVKRGELVFMIGPSGSGKSSLLRCCNRLEEATAGSIHVDGDEITAPAAPLNRIRQNIGMVFQHFN
ncbi:MAG TPA: ectoine/hydroxyectoine ABC transporter ATP-binding protein EhuA, partial [Achromobacter sp.]|nr:ectoine/hydroxyectoine ABC transporter ATP-binding protein EhuA [Achromobacter sp.]